MNKLIKKVLVGVIAGTMMLGSVCTAFAATGSQTQAPTEPVKQEAVKATDGSKVNTSSTGKATVTSVKKTSKSSVTVASTVKVNGISYKVTRLEGSKTFANASKATKISLPSTITSIGAKTFSAAKKLKTIAFTSKDAVKVNKTAFKGLNTKKMTITIKVSSKGMSEKEYKATVKALKAAGFKGKIKKVK